MEKNWGFPSARRGLQAVAMRLPLLLLLLLLRTAAFAQDANVLNKRLSYHAQGQPLLKVLTDIREITKVRFTYNSDMIRKQAAVTVDVKAVTLNEVLKTILANTGLDFQQDLGGGVTIYPHEVSKTEEKKVMQIVTGRVVEQNGSPLSGATVQALGSKQGTVTMQDGMFSVLANESDEVRVSLMGMKTVTQAVKGQTGKLVVIRMDTVSQAIGEVVVNGYQKIDARMSTAAVFKLDAAEVITPGVTSIDQMLQGKVPGLMVMNSSGSVNAKPTIRVRGTSTFVGNASPLWVIDNVVRQDPVDISATQLNTAISDLQTGNFSLIGGAISGVNPYDIESITFLRDAAATAIYGVRAANGVIVVTTKRGKAGPLQVSYNTDLSFQQRPSYASLNLMNSQQRVELARQMQEDGVTFNGGYGGLSEAISYEGLTQALYAHQLTMAQYTAAVQKIETGNTDWFKSLFRNAFSMSHSIGISGGTGKTTYYGSLSYANNLGAAQQDGNKRYTADLALHHEAGGRLTLDFSLSGAYAQSTGYYQTNPLTYALQTSRALPADAVYPKSGSFVFLLPTPSALTFNMQNEIAHTENSGSVRTMMAQLVLNYKIAEGFSFKNTTSAQTDGSDQISAADASSYYIANLRGWNADFTPTDQQVAGSKLPYGGLATISNLNSVTYNVRNEFGYNKHLFADRDQMIFNIGNEIRSTKITGLSMKEPGYFPDRGQQFMANEVSRSFYSSRSITNTVNNVLSFYGTAVYSIDNKYVVTGTLRTEGSNRFGQYSNARFLPNYGLSGKWNVGNERWLAKSRALSGLALRVSFGTQGNVVSAVGPELIASYAASGTVNSATGVPYLGIKSLAYPDLRWEKTYQWNLGADVALFDGRVNVNADYFLKKSVDLIVSKPIPYEYGIDEMWVNAGSALNTGLDLVVSVSAIRKHNTSLDIRFINGWVKNQVSRTNNNGTVDDYFNGTALIPGRPRSAFYSMAYKGLQPSNGLPGFYNMDKKPSTDPAQYLTYSGQLYPKFDGSVSPMLRIGNITLNAELYYALGGHKRLNPLINRNGQNTGVPNPFDNASVELLNRWRKPGDEQHTNIPVAKVPNNAEQYVYLPLVPAQGAATTVNTSLSIYKAYDLSDIRVANSSFARCRNMKVDYNVPARLLGKSGIKSMHAGVFARNLFTIASKEMQGQDPEIDGVGTTALPVTRQYGLSLGVIF